MLQGGKLIIKASNWSTKLAFDQSLRDPVDTQINHSYTPEENIQLSWRNTNETGLFHRIGTNFQTRFPVSLSILKTPHIPAILDSWTFPYRKPTLGCFILFFNGIAHEHQIDTTQKVTSLFIFRSFAPFKTWMFTDPVLEVDLVLWNRVKMWAIP